MREIGYSGSRTCAGIRVDVEALSVAELLERCRRRPPDDAAWQEFVRRYHSTIKGNVVKTFQRKVREDAERRIQFTDDLIDDLTQAVYLRLIEEESRAIQLFTGRHENSIFQYLSMIAINVVRDHFREAKAVKRPKIAFSLDELMESGDGVLGTAALSSWNGTPNNYAGQTLTRDELDNSLNKAVTGRNRDRDILIFKLRHYEGLTLREITTILNLDLSPVSVGSILNRTAQKLRPLLNQNRGSRSASVRSRGPHG